MPYITPRNITTKYKEDKKFGKLIRSQRFEVSSDDGNTNLKFRITYLKPSEEYPFDININLKVSGRLRSWGWAESSKDITTFRNSSRSRNNDIRGEVRYELRNFFKLLGVQPYSIEIKKIVVCKEI